MIEVGTLATYIAIVLGFVFIPGPATMLIVARSSSSGKRVGIATSAGIALGDMIHTIFAIVGISAIIAASALLFSIIKYLGAAYLIYLGIRAMLEKNATYDEDNIVKITPKKAFQQAILVEVLNPKTALFFLAFLPQFVDPEIGMVSLQLCIFGILFLIIGFFSTIVFALGADVLGQKLRKNSNLSRWQGKFVGSIYCLLGAKLAMQD